MIRNLQFLRRFLQDNNTDSTNLHDFVVFSVVCFFSLFFTLCGSLLAYYSWRETKLLNDYIKNGLVVDGYIVAKEWLRIIPSKRETETEFSATCEYEQPVNDNNSIIRVRKQVRVRDGDLIYKSIHLAKAMRSLVVIDRKKNEVCVVQLFVLPGFPLSGYPCKAAERATTMRYQISTMFLIVALFCVSLFCVVTFAGLIGEMIQLNETKSTWLGSGLILTLTFIELTIIHGCFKFKIDSALHQEYKVSGEYDFPYEQ